MQRKDDERLAAAAALQGKTSQLICLSHLSLSDEGACVHTLH